MLSRIYGFPGIDLFTGKGGLPFIKINNKFATAEISLMGGHIVSYTPAGERPVLWMSEKSMYRAGNPLRGGIPVCWPWFGAASDAGLPDHGFARISDWNIKDVSQLADGATQIELVLDSAKSTISMAKWDFRLEMKITVGKSLAVALTMYNSSDTPQKITSALHNYFSVSDISNIQIKGLDGAAFFDKSKEVHHYGTQKGNISFSDAVTKVFFPTAATAEILDPVWNRNIIIEKSGSQSTVVWNPWIDKACAMPDFGNDEYRQMVCIETANATDDARLLLPGVPHTLSQKISVQRTEK